MCVNAKRSSTKVKTTTYHFLFYFCSKNPDRGSGFANISILVSKRQFLLCFCMELREIHLPGRLRSRQQITCAGKKRGTETSKVPTRVGLLVISLFCAEVQQPWAVTPGFYMSSKQFFKKITVKYNIYSEIVLLPLGGGIFYYHCTRQRWLKIWGKWVSYY